MKEKLPDGTYKKCPKCKHEFSSNDCDTHIPRVQPCYTCHLLEEHMIPDEPDTKDVKRKDKDADVGDGGKV